MCEPVVKGRSANDVVLYKVMRWSIRRDRNEHWHAVINTMQNALFTGTGYMNFYWNRQQKKVGIKVGNPGVF